MTWSSSNPSVLRVDAATGELYGVRTGTAYVYARTANGLETSCAVAVRTAPTKVTLSAENAKLGAEGGTTQMIAAVSSGSASGTLYYFSSDEEIATVDGHGLVTGGKPGKVTITVWTYNGKGAAYELTVLPKAEKLELSAQHTAIATGRSTKVTAQAKSAEGEPTEADVTYYISGQSEDAGCVSIDEATGEVTGVRRGKALIGARTNNGVESNLVEIEVSVAPAGVTINRASVEIGVGETYRGLSAAVIAPAGETSCATEIAWTTSNEGIVKTDALTGAIYGVKAGTANIVVWTVNGKYAICRVTVKAAPGKVMLNATSARMVAEGQTGYLIATVPSGTASGAITFTSSDENVAMIDDTGLVTTVNPGAAVLTARTYNGKTASCALTVTGAPASVAVNTAEGELIAGRSLTLSATVKDAAGQTVDANLTWFVDPQSSDPGCVTVDAASGEVTGVRSGTAQVRVRTHNGVESEACAVRVVGVPESVSVNLASVEIGVGETFKGLSATLKGPEGEADFSHEIAWTTSNAGIVKTDALTGSIYGVKAGTANIVVWTVNGKYAICKVTVKPAPTKVTLSAENAKLGAEGGTTQMIAAVSSGSASGTLYYFSSDEEIATVDGHGLVTGGKPGKVTITVWTYNGKGAAYELTVLPKAEKLELSAQHTAIATGRSTKVTAQAKSAEGEPTEADVTYYISGQSEDAGCVSIDEATGEVTGVRRGKALIGARTNNGVESNLVEIEVSVAPAGVTINRASVEIGVGETYRGLSAAVIAPAGETSCATEIAWTTSNEGIVKTDALTGAIYGVKAGTANIVVWTVNGKYAICRVTVKAAPTGIRLNASANMMEENGGTVQMSATLPSGSASAALSWFSSDPEVAGIDENGLVTGKKPGKVTITAWTYNGKGAAYELTVVARAASLSFGESEINLSVGQTLNLKATPLAEDGSATVANVSYYVIQTTRAAACLTLNADTGAITGTQRGTTLIGARTASGIEAEPIRVTVTVAPAGIRLNFTSGSIGLGETNTNLVATLIPPEGEDSCESTITWYTSDKSIVSVDAATGAVYGVKVGSAKIYAMTHNGKYAACTVNVKYAPTKITISPTTAVLTEGQTGQFQVTLPSGTASGSKYFYSSDPDVLSVDNNGNVKALTPGSATVTVWTYNGKGASAVVQVRSSATISADMPMPLASTTGSFNNNMSAAEKLEYVIYVAQSKLGKPYVWGAFGPDKFDCSGFTYYCFKQIGVELKQSAYTQGYDSSQPMISSIPDLRRGDLVFFNTVTDSDLSDHAGLYLGNGYFIHASSGGGKVMVSNLASGYYNRVFAWGRRVFY